MQSVSMNTFHLEKLAQEAGSSSKNGLVPNAV